MVSRAARTMFSSPGLDGGHVATNLLEWPSLTFHHQETGKHWSLCSQGPASFLAPHSLPSSDSNPPSTTSPSDAAFRHSSLQLLNPMHMTSESPSPDQCQTVPSEPVRSGPPSPNEAQTLNPCDLSQCPVSLLAASSPCMC